MKYNDENVEALINNYESKHKEGFITEEIDHIINHNFPDIDISKFDDELDKIVRYYKDKFIW